MVDAINLWIQSGCNYQEGLGIYDRYGSNQFFKGILKKANTAANRQKLNELLVVLRDSVHPAVPTKPQQKFPEPPTQAPPKQNSGEMPALLQVAKLRDQTYSELRSLHPYLHITPEGEDLRVLAERIVKLGKSNALHWARYNFLSEGGVDEQPVITTAPPVLIDINLLNEREAVRKSISKAEQRIKGKEKPNRKTVQLIASQKARLKELDGIIAGIKKIKTA